MNPEEIAELKELIEFLKENNIGEFDLERGDLKVRLKFAGRGAGGGPFADGASGGCGAGGPSAASFQPAAVAHAHPAGQPQAALRRACGMRRCRMTRPGCTS